MKFRYVGDKRELTPEGIPSGPLYITAYGFKFKKSFPGEPPTDETVIDIPDKELIKDSAGRPHKLKMLVCKKLANNRHFEQVLEDTTEKPKRKYTRKKGAAHNEPVTSEPATEGFAEA